MSDRLRRVVLRHEAWLQRSARGRMLRERLVCAPLYVVGGSIAAVALVGIIGCDVSTIYEMRSEVYKDLNGHIPPEFVNHVSLGALQGVLGCVGLHFYLQHAGHGARVLATRLVALFTALFAIGLYLTASGVEVGKFASMSAAGITFSSDVVPDGAEATTAVPEIAARLIYIPFLTLPLIGVMTFELMLAAWTEAYRSVAENWAWRADERIAREAEKRMTAFLLADSRLSGAAGLQELRRTLTAYLDDTYLRPVRTLELAAREGQFCGMPEDADDARRWAAEVRAAVTPELVEDVMREWMEKAE